MTDSGSQTVPREWYSAPCVLLLSLARRLALRALYVLDALDLRVCFTWSPSRGPSDSAEAALARLLRADGLPSGASTVSYCVGADPIAVRRYGELLYCAVASPSDDELTAADLVHSAFLIVAATCEEDPPSPARLASFYGKVVVCLHEAFAGHGVQLQSSTEAILRNAKLKAPQ